MLLNVGIFGTQVLILISKKLHQRKNIIGNLFLYMIFFHSSLILLAISIDFESNRAILGIFKLLSLETLIWTMFFLNIFSRNIFRLKFSEKKIILNLLVFISASVLLFLPLNQWNTISLHDPYKLGTTIQPISDIVLIIILLHYIVSACIRSRRVVDKILEPHLKETYKWIDRGFKALSFIVIAYISNLVLYLAPSLNISLIMALYTFTTIFAVVVFLFSMNFMYIGLTLPKWLLHKLYRKYQPMWNKYEEDKDKEQQFEQEMKRLHEIFLD